MCKKKKKTRSVVVLYGGKKVLRQINLYLERFGSYSAQVLYRLWPERIRRHRKKSEGTGTGRLKLLPRVIEKMRKIYLNDSRELYPNQVHMISGCHDGIRLLSMLNIIVLSMFVFDRIRRLVRLSAACKTYDFIPLKQSARTPRFVPLIIQQL